MITSKPANACRAVEAPPNCTAQQTTVTNETAELSICSQKEDRYGWILLVDPYDCTIAVKTNNARNAGFSAVLIRDFNGEEKSRFGSMRSFCGTPYIPTLALVGNEEFDLLTNNFSFPGNRSSKNRTDKIHHFV